MSRAAASLRLVGDIGGTNVRFALAEVSGPTPRLSEPQSFLCEAFTSFAEAIDHYLRRAAPSGPRPASAVVAVAGPVANGAAALTNGPWSASVDALVQAGSSQALLINDYTAVALALRHLGPADLGSIGEARPAAPDLTVAVLGAGTGLGVAAVVRDLGSEAVSATEGGHIAFAPTDDIEIEILRLLGERFGRVSLERILSGPGLVNLRWALGRMGGDDVDPVEPEEVVALAAGEGTLCARTLDRFCAIYGAAAGDFALAYGAQGGVFLGGGIAPRILGWLRKGGFRERFEAKGRFAGYMKAISTQVITHPYAALLGAAEALQPGRGLGH